MGDDSKRFYPRRKELYNLFAGEKMAIDFVLVIGSTTENQIVSDLNAFAMVNKVKIVEINSAQGLMAMSRRSLLVSCSG